MISQRNLEQDQLSRLSGPHSLQSAGKPVLPPETPVAREEECFQQARILFQQLGLCSWEKRPHVHLVKKTEQLVREMKNLDNQKGKNWQILGLNNNHIRKKTSYEMSTLYIK